MKFWTFKIFVNKNNEVYCWLEGLPPKAKARLDSILRYMEITKDWTQTPYFTPLSGYKGISEIKFTVQNIQYRPLGCYGLESNEYTILIGATEKGNRFEPLSAPAIALSRKEKIFKGEESTIEYYY